MARRSPNEIGIHSIRGGTAVGDHNVFFMGPDEEIVLHHSSASRRIYATGAIKAVRYLFGRPSGLYDMMDLLLEQASVTSLSLDESQALLTVYDLEAASLPGIFKLLGEQNISVDMISMSGQHGISFTVAKKDVEAAAALLGETYNIASEVEVVKLVIEGAGMERQSGVAGRVFASLGEQGVLVRIITTSDTNISILIASKDQRTAVETLSEQFSLNGSER
jgi:4-hydroxy-tetrahydrodipicolinate reductase